MTAGVGSDHVHNGDRVRTIVHKAGEVSGGGLSAQRRVWMWCYKLWEGNEDFEQERELI